MPRKIGTHAKGANKHPRSSLPLLTSHRPKNESLLEETLTYLNKNVQFRFNLLWTTMAKHAPFYYSIIIHFEKS